MSNSLSTAATLAFAIATSLNAASINGIVTNKTTGRPAVGDKVALVDLSVGMADAATTTTNTEGKYSLAASGAGPCLIRVDHQGASYFIAAPQNADSADITIYDVSPKVEGVAIDADMLLIEAGQGTIHVRERYLVRNASSPPRTQFSENTFEIALPEGSLLEEAAATRPGGMGTRTHLTPLTQKGHYSFHVPIQPDQGEKETMFEVAYHFPYNGRQTLAIRPIAPADHFVVYTAKGIEFAARDRSRFKAAQEDTRVATHVALNAHPGEEIAFTISGEGRMPPDAGSGTMQVSAATFQSAPERVLAASAGSQEPLSGSRAWLLGGFTLLSVAMVSFVLHRRRQPEMNAVESVQDVTKNTHILEAAHTPHSPPPPRVSGDAGALLHIVKEELFALEQDKISGAISPDEFAQVRAGLESLLKRALESQRQ